LQDPAAGGIGDGVQYAIEAFLGFSHHRRRHGKIAIDPGIDQCQYGGGMLFEGTERKQLERRMKEEGRLPPGQSLTLKWPVLHYGSVPQFDSQTWDFRVYGLVETPVKLGWDEFNGCPSCSVPAISTA
jgi:DMSO/TMAO reductase YedYZ molybdopterin-dependent catalytic subunit